MLAAAPDGDTVLATTQQGLLRSTDAGASWGPVDGAPLLQVVAWADAATSVGVDPAGTVGAAPTPPDVAPDRRPRRCPHAVAAAPVDGAIRVAVVTDAGLAESADSGETFTTLLAS